MAKRKRSTNLAAPFLTRLTVKAEMLEGQVGYPFDQPWLNDDFELEFETPVTVIVGENGTGKSTLIEALAALAGYDPAGGGKGYAAVDHSAALDRSGADLADALRAGWLPKVTDGWFFRAETFFSVARWLDTLGGAAPDYLSRSHGEGFIELFGDRMRQQGFFLMDEPESALSPRRQLELLRFLAEIQQEARAQVILATHSPLLMAIPGADVLRLTRHGFERVAYRETPHFRLMQDFFVDPEGFVAEVIASGGDVFG